MDEHDDPTRRKRQESADCGAPATAPADVHIIFLSSKLLRDPGALRRAFPGRLDVAVVASVLAEAHVHADLAAALRLDGLLLVEGNRFHLLRKEERDNAAAKLVEKIVSVGFELEQEFNAEEDDYARFRVSSTHPISSDSSTSAEIGPLRN